MSIVEKEIAGTPNRSTWRTLPTWLRALSILALTNFIVFVFVVTYLHGDALSGYELSGHYFLNWKGTYTEVSRNVFVYSKAHELSMFGTHAMAICGWLIWRQLKRTA